MSESDLTLARICQLTYESIDIGVIAELLNAEPVHVRSFETSDIAALVLMTSNLAIVAFRGTVPTNLHSIRRNFQSALIDRDFYRIHRGFAVGLDAIWGRVANYLAAHYQGRLKNPRLILTGHSQGGALATIASVAAFNRFLDSPGEARDKLLMPRELVTFGTPRCGDASFAGSLRQLANVTGVRVARYCNSGDPIPWVPPWSQGYRHGVKEIYLTQSGEIATGQSPITHLWHTLVHRVAASRWLSGDSIKCHRISSYVAKLEALQS